MTLSKELFRVFLNKIYLLFSVLCIALAMYPTHRLLVFHYPTFFLYNINNSTALIRINLSSLPSLTLYLLFEFIHTVLNNLMFHYNIMINVLLCINMFSV